MNNKREYKYEVVLSCEKENYEELHANLLMNFDAIWCCHDRDVYETDVYDDENNVIHNAGDLKYKHVHYLIKLKTAKTISAVAKIIDCKESDVSYIKSFKGALKYLIHYRCDDKYEYDVMDVKSNNDKLLSMFKKEIDVSLDMDDRVVPIFQYIDECEYLTFKQLVQYIYSSRQWNTFRANIGIYIKYLDEHNECYKSQSYSILNSCVKANKHRKKS